MEQLKRNIRLEDFTKIPLTLFKLVGMRLINHPDEKRPLIEKFALVMVIINLSLHIILMLAFLLFNTFESDIELTAFGCYAGFILNSLCKALGVWNGRSILQEVIREMENIFPKTDNDIIRYRVGEYYKKVELYMRSLVIYHFSTTTMFNLFPIAQSAFEYMLNGGDFVYRYPFIIFYPFDETKNVIYFLTYCYQACGAYMLSCFFLGADLLLVSTVHNICMHFEFLSNKITDFIPTGTDEDLKELHGFIKYHGNLLSLSFKINEVFNISILMNYIASCGVICLLGFQVTAGSEVLDLLKFFAFLVSSLVHVYFICSFGTNLLEMSCDLSDAVFSHRWYMANNKYKKMLILIIARSNKPVFLTAYKFFIVSMESFKNLVTTSYQFFTLIKTNEEE